MQATAARAYYMIKVMLNTVILIRRDNDESSGMRAGFLLLRGDQNLKKRGGLVQF